MRTLNFTVLLLLVSAVVSTAQSPQPDSSIPKVMPPSPQAASLGKFADIPVGLYTGTPNINIPIFELHEGDLTLPISLDYHASGIKVEETASWSGLGWALNAGGVVTRSIRGSRDEGGDGKIGWLTYNKPIDYEYLPNQIIDIPDPYTGGGSTYLGKIAKGGIDMIPDLYYFNFAGRSGKFFYDSKGQVCMVPYQKIKIDGGFTITTEDGTKYIFSKNESTQTYGHCNGNYSGSSTKDITAWYLTQIVSATGDATINLEYEPYPVEYSYSYQTIDSETKKVQIGIPTPYVKFPDISPVYCDAFVTVFNPARLTRIYTTNIEINFTKGEERCDLKGDYRLKEITINSKRGTTTTLLKKYLLSHKYLNGTQLSDLSMACTPTFPNAGNGATSNYATRLMLDKVTEFGPNDETGKIYQLSYFTSNGTTNGMPSRLSFNQDHWGYYNGRNNDLISTMIPATSMEPGAIREPHLLSTRVGTLSRITYPTGGYSEFDYELHDVNNIGSLKYTVFSPKQIPFNVRPHLQSNGQRIYSDPFQVSSATGSALVNIVLDFAQDCGSNPCRPMDMPNAFCSDLFDFEIWHYDAYGNATLARKLSDSDDFQPNNLTVMLTNGSYKMAHSAKSGYAENYAQGNLCRPYTFTLKWNESTEADVFNTGGLRIKQITDYNGVNLTTRYFEYKDDSGKSTGYAINYPSYSHDQTVYVHTYYSTLTLGCIYSPGVQSLIVYTSSSNQPLGSTQGSSAGYSMVTTYYDDPALSHPNGANGKSVSTFTSPYDFPDLASNQYTSQIPAHSGNFFPFAPNDSQDYFRGLLLSKTDYRKTGGTYFKVKVNTNNYLFRNTPGSPNYFEFWSWKVGISAIKRNTFIDIPPCEPDGFPDPEYDVLYPVKFKMRAGHYELSSTAETIYDNNDESKFSTTLTSYINSITHLQPTQITKTTSDGKSETSFIKYPSDFTATLSDIDPASVALAKLVEQNRITIPVETRTVVDGGLVNGTLTKFKDLSGKIQKDEVYLYRTVNPVLNPGKTSVTGGEFKFESFTNNQGFEQALKFTNYDGHGNILAYQTTNNITNSYLWDYNSRYPIAEVNNAVQADIAYTSFEADGFGNWGVIPAQRDLSKAHTGSQCYNMLSGNLSASGLNTSKTYVLSFWYHSGGLPTVSVGTPVAGETRNGWTNYKLTFTASPSVMLSGTGIIDELRLHPLESQMTTYTYLPGVGVTSSTDVNNITTYFEYNLGRLNKVKDEKKNLVKNYEYHYKE